MGICEVLFSLCCCARKESRQEEEGVLPPAVSPSTPDSSPVDGSEDMGKAISKIRNYLSPDNKVSSASGAQTPNAVSDEALPSDGYEALASPRSPLIRSRESLTPPETPVLPPAKRLKDDVLYLDFPILKDEATIEYVRRNKLMVILKGLPGSGKSAIARNIKKIYPDAVVCSADHFFMVDGIYQFDVEKLKDAHESCQNKARQAARRNSHLIVIDNTNVRHWESAVYLQMCKTYHYVALFMEPQTPWRFDAEKLASYNSHKVDEGLIAKKVKSYQQVLPIYYAWFLNEADSQMISKIAWQWLEKALLEIDDFLQDFLQVTELDSMDDILNYFSNKNTTLHVTANFTNRGKFPGALEYINSDLVKQSMGKCFPISIIGYVITPYSFGARIQLNEDQLQLWGQDDLQSRPDNLMVGGNFSPNKENSTQDSIEDESSDDTTDVLEVCEQRIIISDQETSENRFWPTSGKGSRAHFTLGCAAGVKPVATGFDLIDIVACEERAQEKASEVPNQNAMDVDAETDEVRTYDCSGAVMKCYGEGRWVLYPENKVVAESFFSAFY